jgi:obg-like ATPase 1
MWKPKSKKPSTLSIVDIAGLVPGASKGEGLGNSFLSHIRETDAIYHLVRAFDDPEIAHTENEVDPVRDLQIISDELVYKDIEILEKRMEDVNHKIARMNDKDAKEEKETLDKVAALLNQKKWITIGDWSAKDVEILNKHMFLTAKSVVYLVNLSENDFIRKKNKWLPKIKQWVETNLQGEIIPYSASYEKKVFEAQESAEKPTEPLTA